MIRPRDPNRPGLVPFVANPNQIKAHEAYRRQMASGNPLRVICVKSRRIGFSRDCLSIGMAHLMSTPGGYGTVAAQIASTAEELFSQVQEWYEGLPVTLGKTTKTSLSFPHREAKAKLTWSTAKNAVSGRGGTRSWLMISEGAYIQIDAFNALLSMVSKKDPNSIIQIESTANGKVGDGEAFYNLWNQAWEAASKRKFHSFLPIFLGWLEDPDCVRDPSEARDAPRTDLERELMRDYKATKGQIAWMRDTMSTFCNGLEDVFCLHGETIVSTQRGFVPISSCVVGDQLEGTNITNIYNRGVKPIVKVKLRNGLELRCTPDHRILTVRRGFQEAKDCRGLAVRLGTPRFASEYATVEVEDEGTVTIDETWGEFLGYFVADGSINSNRKRGGWYLSMVGDARDLDVKRRVLEICTYVLGSEPYGRQTSVNGWEYRKGCTRLYYILRKIGVARTERPHRIVRVPEAIMCSPRSVVRAFLRGVFEGDGSASRKRYGAVLFSESKELLRGCQKLLLGFSITSRIKDKWLILQGEESEAFIEDIGFIGNRKQASCKKLPFASTGRGNACVRITMTDRIVSVEDDGQAQVYDISCAPEHYFQADGLIVHNCQEYPWCPDVAFLSSGDPAFTRAEIRYAQRTVHEGQTIFKGRLFGSNGEYSPIPSKEGPWKIFQNPLPGHYYYIGGDSARGDEGYDYTTASVWDGQTGEQVASLKGHIRPDDFAFELNSAGHFYLHGNSPAKLLIEITGHTGGITQSIIRDRYRYPNLYFWKGSRNDRPKGKAGMGSLGWDMTERSRKRALEQFRTDLTSGKVKVRDPEALEQMEIAKRGGGGTYDWRIEEGHDDVFTALILGWMCLSDFPAPGSPMQSKRLLMPDDSSVRLLNAIRTEESGFGFLTMTNRHQRGTRMRAAAAERQNRIDSMRMRMGW